MRIAAQRAVGKRNRIGLHHLLGKEIIIPRAAFFICAAALHIFHRQNMAEIRHAVPIIERIRIIVGQPVATAVGKKAPPLLMVCPSFALLELSIS